MPQPGWVLGFAQIRVFGEWVEGTDILTAANCLCTVYVWLGGLASRDLCSGVFKDGMVQCPLWRDNICGFLRIQILEKWTKLPLPLNVELLSVLASRRFGPLTSDSAPRPCCGLCPQIAVISSRPPCMRPDFRALG